MAGEQAPVEVGLIVTGKGEAEFLPLLFQCLVTMGMCRFRVIRRIGQLSPRTSEKVRRPLLQNKKVPTRDEELGIAVRGALRGGYDLVVVVDDLEYSRKELEDAVFARYRTAVDTFLDAGEQARASVHFLVYMLEAYYFADAAAVNEVLGTGLSDYVGDVEQIRHPKNDLKNSVRGFDEIKHGEKIVPRLNLDHILRDPQTCAGLRTLFTWLAEAMTARGILWYQPLDDPFQMRAGLQRESTRGQLAARVD